MRSRELFPQPHGELELQALRNKEPPQPRGPSLLTLQALQELDLTACSKLSDASLAKVGLGCGQAGAPGGGGQEPGAWAHPLWAWKVLLIGFYCL